MPFFRRKSRAAACLLLSLALAAPARPAPARAPAKKSAVTASAKRGKPPMRIRKITILQKDIFDTRLRAENRAAYRLVNALHVSTKEHAIRRELLFKEGDLYNHDIAKETERALRRILRLRAVKVTPLPVNKTTVDVIVRAQETWTTEPTISVSGVGGDLSGKAGIKERNLFGLGKSASFFYKKKEGIISRELSYADPALLGSRLRLDGGYEDREDGTLRSLSIERPFRATVTPWAAGVGGRSEEREVLQFDNMGKEIAKLDQETRDLSGTLSVSLGSTTRFVRRLRPGYQYIRDDLFSRGPRLPVREDLYHIFSLGGQFEKQNFLEVDHIKQYDRDEDFPLGPALDFRAGFSRRKWVPGARNANFFSGSFVKGRSHGPSHFSLATLSGNGRFQKDRWRGSSARLDLEYYNHFQARQTLACHLGGEAIVNPGPTDQILLGGDTGLRGYQLNQFAGNKKLLANVEDRFFVVDDVLRFMSLGAVAFFDAGYVWPPGRELRAEDVKMDVGAGLRFHLTRTSLGHVLRLDVAYALREVPGEDRVIITFGSSQAF